MNRVVITGMGTINALGLNVKESMDNIIKGDNGIDKITRFDATDFKVRVAAELKNFNLEDYFSKQEIRRNDRVTLYGLIAADEAIKMSGINQGDFDPYRFGVYFTSGIGGMETLEEEIINSSIKGASRISPFFIPKAITNITGAAISIKHGLKGPNTPIVTACSASTNSIGEAFRNIKHGYLDLAIAGGAEAAITKVGIGGFQSLRALSTTADVNRASIPFDKERSGFVMGEGSGALILENYDHAIKRGATIYGEIIGYGTTGDAHHITAPDESGETIAKAIEFALNEAGLNYTDIDYINAHGTSTELNDLTETTGIKKAFKEHAYNLNISSTKSMIGHTLGAAGAIESIVTLKALELDLCPPTINIKEVDPSLDLNYTINKTVYKNVNYALTMNLGFGGHNAVLIYKKGVR